MEFGRTLREAREAKGYSIAQLADMTHIMSQVVEGLENEDFKKIPAPIYGRGFVKLCCQALGLEEKPMIDEFMAIYSGAKPPARPAPAPAVAKPVVQEPVAPAPVVTAAAPAPSAPQGDLFGQSVTPQPVSPEPPAAKSVSRFAPPTTDATYTRPALEMPAIPWRLVILIIAAVAAIWIAVVCCRSLYRTLSSEGEASEPAKSAETARPASGGSAEPAAAKAPRTPKPVKSLYID